MADLAFTASNIIPVSANQQPYTLAAGVSCVPGDILTLDANSNLVKAQCTSDALSITYEIFMALSTGSAGQPVVVAKVGATIDANSVFTAGTPYFLSSNAGKVCPRADLGSGHRVVQLLYSLSATRMYFSPLKYNVTL